jgi:predicted phosphodiesterase
MSPSTIAIISDVHGNRWALAAVLADIAAAGVDRIVNLGDCAYGPLAPGATVRRLRELDIPTVRGNEDRLLGDRTVSSPTLDYTRSQLTGEDRDWLVSLPARLRLEEGILLCHGTPAADDEYLLRAVAGGIVRDRSGEEIRSRLCGVDEPVIACGHDHVPGAVRLPDGRLVVNPGSVGLPAYTDDHPALHAVATGTPHARYCLLSRVDTMWEVEPRRVEYDRDAAAAAAQANGSEDWAHWLRTGRAG